MRLTWEFYNRFKAVCAGADPVALNPMAQGSTGNVIAALASFFIPGLGQLLQGRVLAAIFFFILSGAIWVVSFGFLGVLGHIFACLEAAVHKTKYKESL